VLSFLTNKKYFYTKMNLKYGCPFGLGTNNMLKNLPHRRGSLTTITKVMVKISTSVSNLIVLSSSYTHWLNLLTMLLSTNISQTHWLWISTSQKYNLSWWLGAKIIKIKKKLILFCFVWKNQCFDRKKKSLLDGENNDMFGKKRCHLAEEEAGK